MYLDIIIDIVRYHSIGCAYYPMEVNMSNNASVALNEAELDKRMLEVIDCGNKVKAIFNKVDDAVEKLKTTYQCAGATALYNRYDEFNDYYSVIVDNIMSYNSDLMSLKKKYATSLGDLSDKIRADALKLESNSVKAYVEKR